MVLLSWISQDGGSSQAVHHNSGYNITFGYNLLFSTQAHPGHGSPGRPRLLRLHSGPAQKGLDVAVGNKLGADGGSAEGHVVEPALGLGSLFVRVVAHQGDALVEQALEGGQLPVLHAQRPQHGAVRARVQVVQHDPSIATKQKQIQIWIYLNFT